MAEAKGKGWGIAPRGDGLLYSEDASGGGSGGDVVADWNRRSAGAFFAENFSSYATAQEMAQVSWSQSGDLPGVYLDGNMDFGTHPLSGKSCRMWIDENTSASPGAYIRAFTPNEPSPPYKQLPNVRHDGFYIQFVTWGDDYYNWPFAETGKDTVWPDPSDPWYPGYPSQTQTNPKRASPKHFIIDDVGGDNVGQGEVVVNNQFSRGFVTAYRRDGGNNRQFIRQVTMPEGSTNADVQQPEIDGLVPANPATDAQFRQRYGHTALPREYLIAQDPPDGPEREWVDWGKKYSDADPSRYTAGGVPNPDGSIPGVTYNRGGHTVVTMYVSSADRVVKIWASHYGQDPKLIVDSTDFTHSRAIDGYTGCYMVLQSTARGAEPGVRPRMGVEYCEVIASYNPIQHPMSFMPLPGAPASTLGTFSAGLASGETQPFTMPGMNSSLINTPPPTNSDALTFAVDAIHDPVRRRIRFIGTGHASSAGGSAVLTYDEDAHLWTKVRDPAGISESHRYYHHAIDFATGDDYVRGHTSTPDMWYHPFGAPDDAAGWDFNTTVPTFNAVQVAGSMVYVPWLNGGQSGLVHCETRSIRSWGKGDASWQGRLDPGPAPTPYGTLDIFAVAPRNGTHIYCGGGKYDPGSGNVSVLNWGRFDDNFVWEQLPDLPFGAGLWGSKGRGPVIEHPDGVGILVVQAISDAATSGGSAFMQLWHYDPISTNWTRLDDIEVDDRYVSQGYNIVSTLTTYNALLLIMQASQAGDPDTYVHKL